MQRVTGIGGIFFKAQDPEALRGWYQRHLGIALSEQGFLVFAWTDAQTPDHPGTTVFSIVASDSSYFAHSAAPFMINFRVAQLAVLLEQLRSEGVAVDEPSEATRHGRFAWITDPAGNRSELWEPPVGASARPATPRPKGRAGTSLTSTPILLCAGLGGRTRRNAPVPAM
jgi:predicted enzyme related to lactoylglutathione lyase